MNDKSDKSEERRRSPRSDLRQVVRIRPFDPQLPPEYCTTLNVSRDGLYFTTSAAHYTVGTNVYVTGDFQPGSPIHKAVAGAIVRVDELADGQFGVAIQILAGNLKSYPHKNARLSSPTRETKMPG